MKPVLQEGEFVFCSLDPETIPHWNFEPVMLFQEKEGTTVILDRGQAERFSLDYRFPSRMITLTIHSSLEAVGFLAMITAELAAAGISVNAVSAYFHDHLFVPAGTELKAMRLLEELAGDPTLT